VSPEARAARERKQKIFVAAGGLFLLALLAFQLPKLLGGSESTATPAATTTTAADGTTTTMDGAPPVDDAVPVSVGLVDTDRRLKPGPGQLRSFDTFSRKDPFVQQIKDQSSDAASEGGATGGGAPPGGGGKTPETPSKGFTVGESTAAAAVTVISVNGARQALTTGMAFPAADPVFVLVTEQPDAKAVIIGVAGGAYANGDRTTKLKLGKPVVLVNTATGARYRIVLVSVGNGSATSAAGPSRDEGSATTPTP
jgi:hypothetical protein